MLMEKKRIPKNKENKDTSRLREIMVILAKNEIVKGLSPERLRRIIEDLGPTYIKLGQIMSMRSDIIPKRYCDELAKLRTEVQPMDFTEVESVIEDSFGSPLSHLFSSFEEIPLGSASIAQAHKAVLKTGETVVVKVQRKDIYETMAKDIVLLKKAARLMKIAGGTGEVIDFNMVLDELWYVTQEELNFLTEANNAEEIYENNRDVAYVTCPKVFKNFTTSKVLVMEYIDGIPINDIESLKENGYDLDEIGKKLAENYAKQIIEDGFFHADPHPGNILIEHGKIVWIDLGMMGRISLRDQRLFMKAIEAVARGDIAALKEVILTIGDRKGKINHNKLYRDIDDMLSKYGTMDIGGMDLAKVIDEILELAKAHRIALPAGVSMLGRGVSALEGVLSDLNPEINFIEITGSYMASNILADIDLKKGMITSIGVIIDSWKKVLTIPSLVSDLLKMSMKGQTKIGMELELSTDFKRTANKLVNNLNTGILVAALLVGSSILSTTDMEPRILNIPALGAIGFFIAFILSIWLFIDLRRH